MNEEIERLKRYIAELEAILNSEDDGYTFGSSGWRFHLSAEFKRQDEDE
jgi:hypothetical protein